MTSQSDRRIVWQRVRSVTTAGRVAIMAALGVAGCRTGSPAPGGPPPPVETSAAPATTAPVAPPPPPATASAPIAALDEKQTRADAPQTPAEIALANARTEWEKNPDNEDLAFQLALVHVRRREHQVALDLLAKLAARHPASSNPIRWTGEVYDNLNDRTKALEHFRRARDLEPNRAENYIGLVKDGMQQGRYDEALLALKDAFDRVQSGLPLLPLLDQVYREAREAKSPDRIVEAAAVLKRELERPGQTAQALIVIGLIYEKAGERERADEAFRRAIERDPADPEPYRYRAALQLVLQDTKGALDILDTGVNQAKPPYALHVFRGEILLGLSGSSQDPAEQQRLFDGALSSLESGLAGLTNNVDLLVKVGEMRARKKDVAGALAAFERVEQILPDDVLKRMEMAQSLLGGQTADEAIRELDRLSRTREWRIRAMAYAGILMYLDNVPPRAAQRFDQVLRLQPNDVVSIILRAIIEKETDRPAAIARLRAALQSQPGQPRLMATLAAFLVEDAKYRDAIDLYRQLDRMPETHPRKYEYLPLETYAAACLMDGEWDWTIEILVRAIEKQPLSVVRFAGGILAEKDTPENRTRLKDVLSTLLEASPKEPYFHYAMATCLLSMEATNAVVYFASAEKAAATRLDRQAMLDNQFLYQYGCALDLAGLEEEAVKRWEDILARFPNDPDAHNAIAYSFAERNIRLDEALVHVYKALATAPSNPAYLDTLAWIQFRQGRFEDALKEITKAVNAMPGDPTIQDHYGDILSKLGKTDAAIEAWKKAFLLKPGIEGLREKLESRGVPLPSAQPES